MQFDHVLYSSRYIPVGEALWLRAADPSASPYEDSRHVCTHVRNL